MANKGSYDLGNEGMRTFVANGTDVVESSRIEGSGGANAFQRDGAGKMSWGDGASAPDTNLYRSGANALKTDDTLVIAGALEHTGSTVGFYGVTPAARPSAYTISNPSTDRAFDVSSTTTGELAAVLGTLIADLKTLGILQ